MIDPRWVLLSLAFSLSGSIIYGIATVIGTARPNLVTWSLWAAAATIGSFAESDSGVGLPATQTFSAEAAPLLVVIVALLSGHWRFRVGVFDPVCGLVSVAALAVSLTLDQPTLAVLFAVVADAAAALPTVRKAWSEPFTENLPFYLLVAAGSAITLATVDTPAPAAWAFAAYILFLAVGVSAVIVTRRRRVGAGPGRRTPARR